MNDLRDEIAREIVGWCIANGEEFLPNPLADRIVALLDRRAEAAERRAEYERRHRQWALKKARLYHDCSEHYAERAEVLEAEVEQLRTKAWDSLRALTESNAELAEKLDTSEEECRRLRELRKYANHLDTCAAWSTECDDTAIALNADDCDCGLDEIDAALATQAGETPPYTPGQGTVMTGVRQEQTPPEAQKGPLGIPIEASDSLAPDEVRFVDHTGIKARIVNLAEPPEAQGREEAGRG